MERAFSAALIVCWFGASAGCAANRPVSSSAARAPADSPANRSRHTQASEPAAATSTRLINLPIEERPELRSEFTSEGVQGTILVFDTDTHKLSASDVERCQRPHVPASTFKITSSLIGLEIGVTELDSVFRWDGMQRPVSEWNRDLTLSEAVGASCVPCFVELARRIGDARMQQWLARLDYGNREISAPQPFWLRGGLRISPIQQLDFVYRLDTGALPIRRSTREALLELFKLESDSSYVLRGKTGSALPPDEPELVGWFVGWVERGPRRVYFATALDSAAGHTALLDGRRRVTERVLRRIGAMPQGG